MNTRRIVVTARDGSAEQCPADLVVCEACGHAGFYHFVIRRNGQPGHLHAHLQCAGCGVSYCQAGDDCKLTAGRIES